MSVDARSCVHREAINVDAFEEHVSSLHADGDYLLSQEYEVRSFHSSLNWLIDCFHRADIKLLCSCYPEVSDMFVCIVAD